MTLAKAAVLLAPEVGRFRGKRALVRGRKIVSPLLEHSRVRARREIRDSGESIPAGAAGTIVGVTRVGVRGRVGGSVSRVVYAVEFTSPKHAVVSALRSELAPV